MKVKITLSFELDTPDEESVMEVCQRLSHALGELPVGATNISFLHHEITEDPAPDPVETS